MPTDPLGRPLISDAIKSQITTALRAIPSDKRGVVLVVADEHGTRGMLAANINGHWKVAAGGGWNWNEPRPSGYVAAELAF